MSNSVTSNISRPVIIAEVAQAHDGSIALAHSYIDAVSEVGADAIKFQAVDMDRAICLLEELVLWSGWTNESSCRNWNFSPATTLFAAATCATSRTIRRP